MKIAIDLDEILANYTKDFLEYYNNNYDASYKLGDITDYSYKDIDFKKEPHPEVMEKFHKSSLTYKNLSIVPEAKEAVAELSKNNKLYILTSRNQELKEITLNWVKMNFPDTFEDVIIAGAATEAENDNVSKLQHCLDLGISLLIDDNLKYAEECAEHGLKAILFNYPWNQKTNLNKNIMRVHAWKEVLGVIEKISK